MAIEGNGELTAPKSTCAALGKLVIKGSGALTAPRSVFFAVLAAFASAYLPTVVVSCALQTRVEESHTLYTRIEMG